MRHRIATYIAKYIGKDADEARFNKKRYWTSRGIVVPEVEPYAHFGHDCGMREAVIAAHECLLGNGGTFDGAQFSLNHGLGVFWVAAGNTDRD